MRNKVADVQKNCSRLGISIVTAVKGGNSNTRFIIIISDRFFYCQTARR
jgi:hypothetical protein